MRSLCIKGSVVPSTFVRSIPSKVDISRRQTLQNAVLVCSTLLLPKPVFSAEDSFQVYTDPVQKFTLSYPSTWTSVEGTSTDDNASSDRILAWHPKEIPPKDVNISLKVTYAGADFTKLGSFGTAEDFANNLVNSMDRSYLKRGFQRPNDRQKEVQTASLISAINTNGMYKIEYLLKPVKDQEKRFISLVALRFDGMYNKLYTLTSQCYEKDFPTYQSQLQSILDSFEPPGQ